jgi:hypothetical protein
LSLLIKNNYTAWPPSGFALQSFVDHQYHRTRDPSENGQKSRSLSISGAIHTEIDTKSRNKVNDAYRGYGLKPKSKQGIGIHCAVHSTIVNIESFPPQLLFRRNEVIVNVRMAMKCPAAVGQISVRITGHM